MGKSLDEKQAIRYRMVYLAFGSLLLIPLLSLGLLLIGVDPSSANSIFSTSSITFGAIIIGFFGTAPKDDNV